jgi:hypothetical protein
MFNVPDITVCFKFINFFFQKSTIFVHEMSTSFIFYIVKVILIYFTRIL